MSNHRVRPGTRVRLSGIDSAATDGLEEHAARERLERSRDRLAKLQEVLYAEQRRAVLVVMQGMDTAGKDGTIRHVMNRCSTRFAPWYAIPSDRRWYRNLAVAEVLADRIEALGCKFPPSSIRESRLRRIRL